MPVLDAFVCPMHALRHAKLCPIGFLLLASTFLVARNPVLKREHEP
jgi:hypothetical protein